MLLHYNTRTDLVEATDMSVYKIMNCRFYPVALLDILSIVRRPGLIHNNNNEQIENIHVKSLRCGAGIILQSVTTPIASSHRLLH